MSLSMSKQISGKESNIKIVTHGFIDLWSESFGDPNNPGVILIMGAGEPGIMWPTSFCEDLAHHGLFVIRFDYRDTGKSSSVDYQKFPYTIMDLTKDTIALLNDYEISKAHFVGFSMGGQIAQFIGAYFPERALSLTLIGTSSSFEEAFTAFAGKIMNKGLSAPHAEYVKWATRPQDLLQNLEQKKQRCLENFRRLNGPDIPIDEKTLLPLIKERFERTQLHNSYMCHAQAMMSSYQQHRKALNQIFLPTLILQGEIDPVFPIDHGHSLHQKIINSHLKIIEGMGHFLNPHFLPEIIQHLISHI